MELKFSIANVITIVVVAWVGLKALNWVASYSPTMSFLKV